MTENQDGNTTSISTGVTNTPTQETVISAKVTKPKGKPPVVPIVEPAILQEKLIEEPFINVGPLKDITRDTHTRMVQYLGIVNPGVLRVMAEMLAEQETKTINFLVSAGIKFG